MKKNICIISGPTASGKTKISIALAKKIDAQIVNFDSLLFYKELNIGTAKPTILEQGDIVHYMIDNHTIGSPINAADFYKEALPIIEKIHSYNKNVILVGGSGFYLQAILYGMYESATTPEKILEKSNHLYKKEGISPFIQILKDNDDASFNRYHQNDHYRIIRAVEHFWTTGLPFSQSRLDMDQKRLEGPMFKNNWNVYHIHLDLPKDEHFQIIQDRTQQMIKNGLIDEVKHLLNSGFSGQEKPLKSIGYKETIEYINGNIKTVDELIQRINISTRQLAKSQRTWFKKVLKKTYNPIEDQEKIYNDYISYLKKETS
jgi:tRNA dimethylallyltransferase